jgi:hypothetical protein
MLDKLQKYLKAKHKFDHKPDFTERWEILNNTMQALKIADKTNNRADLRRQAAQVLLEFVKYCNAVDVDLSNLLVDELKINL